MGRRGGRRGGGEGAWRGVDEIRDNQMAIKRKCKKHKVMRRWSYGYYISVYECVQHCCSI